MDATFTEEQRAFRDAVRDLLDSQSPIEHVRAVADGAQGWDPDLWGRLVALGATDLPGMVELGIVLEECGRTLAPVPVASAVAIAGTAVATAAPDDELTVAVRTGQAIAILTDGLVADALAATHLVRCENGRLVVHDAATCVITPQPTMDRTRRLCDVIVDSPPVELGPAEPALTRARQAGAVALAHELVGVAQACLDRAVDHARTREQFGRTIGSYQAVSHRCVDMFLAVESARGLAYYAAWASDVDAPDAELSASRAKAAAGDAAVFCAQNAIQVHGGIGFTWEHDLHLYLKRARAASAQLGTPGWHRQRIADLMGVA